MVKDTLVQRQFQDFPWTLVIAPDYCVSLDPFFFHNGSATKGIQRGHLGALLHTVVPGGGQCSGQKRPFVHVPG